MVLACLPSDAPLQHILSYLGFSYLGCGHLFMAAPAKRSSCSWPWIQAVSSQPQLLTLAVGYLLLAATPDLGCLVSPLCRSLRQYGAVAPRQSDFGTSSYLKLFWGYHLEDTVSLACLTVLQEHIAPTLIRPVSTAGVPCDLHLHLPKLCQISNTYDKIFVQHFHLSL